RHLTWRSCWTRREQAAALDALRRHGLRVWVDEFTLHVGGSLRSSIDIGLAQARHGGGIISPAFLSKEWPRKELNGSCDAERTTEMLKGIRGKRLTYKISNAAKTHFANEGH